jgi:hypothetical protein
LGNQNRPEIGAKASKRSNLGAFMGAFKFLTLTQLPGNPSKMWPGSIPARASIHLTLILIDLANCLKSSYFVAVQIATDIHIDML